MGWRDPCVRSLPSASRFSSGRRGDHSPPHLIHCLFSSSSEPSAKENYHAYFVNQQTGSAGQDQFALLSPWWGLSLDSLLLGSSLPPPDPPGPPQYERHCPSSMWAPGRPVSPTVQGHRQEARRTDPGHLICPGYLPLALPASGLQLGMPRFRALGARPGFPASTHFVPHSTPPTGPRTPQSRRRGLAARLT